jgi:hypothetical protein
MLEDMSCKEKKRKEKKKRTATKIGGQKNNAHRRLRGII